MNEPLLKYLAFIVAVSILIWGVMELNKRLDRHKKMDAKSHHTWIKLDAVGPDAGEDVSSDLEYDDQEEMPQPDMRMREQQNGHHSESKRIT
jgi:hypothetical protein